MSSLLTRVKSKLFIPSQRRSLSVLEGEYRSLSFGRSSDFEDLREYEAGDDVKDIDWKATARSAAPLVRRYISARRHTVMLVSDTGINMKAVTRSGEQKSSIALLSLGVLGFLSVRHTDSVSALYGDSTSTYTVPAKSTESHLERILQEMNASYEGEAKPSDIMAQLRYLLIHFPRKMIVVVAADDFEPTEENLTVLRTLKAKHDLLWLSIADADPIDTVREDSGFDVLDGYQIPDFIHNDSALIREFSEAEQQRKQEMLFALAGLRIPHVELDDSDTVVARLISLLGRRKNREV